MSKQSVFTGIDHPAIAANDVEKLADWYCEVLDYEKFFKDPQPIWIIKAADGSYIEIMPKDDNPRQQRTVCTPGLSHLALRVSDFEAAVAQLDSKGVVWTSGVFEAKGGGKIRNFEDPEGNMLQIVDRG